MTNIIQAEQNNQISTNIPHHKYKNIIFDLGAVLVKFNPKELVEELFKKEPTIPYELIDALHNPLWLNIDRGTMTPDEVIEALSGQFDKAKLTRFFYEVPPFLTPLQDGLDILKQVQQKGYKTYVLSNLYHDSYEIIKHYDFIKTFDGWIYSYQHKCAKPEQEIYQKLLSLYNLSPHECLFIDDLPQNIAGAQAMGIDGIVCTNHDYVRQQLQALRVL